MKSFLREVAEQLYSEYGEDVSGLRIVFPSRRARLFFNDALSAVAGRPLWQPQYISLDEIMEQIAGIKRSDPIRLITELFKTYSKYHNESFDHFYFWGEMLLADFDSIDKYLIDASTLFVNIADLKRIETDYTYLTPEQILIIKEFWRNFNIEDISSSEKQHFIGIWNSLNDIYKNYHTLLKQSGMAYQGMIYRTAAERAVTGQNSEQDKRFSQEKYIFAGFNALSLSERRVLKYLDSLGVARFFWDYDTYYTKNSEQEAGMFLRDNVRRFPEENFAGEKDNFVKPKEVVTIAAPSDAMQCKYVTDFLNDIASKGESVDKNTAIVLTNENLLLPVLYSIPEMVSQINITMGYPLRQTPAYTFVERLIELQQHKKKRGDKVIFYHADVTGILTHPYVVNITGDHAIKLSEKIVARGQIYVGSELLNGEKCFEKIFCDCEGWVAICDYITSVFSYIGGNISVEDRGNQREFFMLIIDNIEKLKNSLTGCEVEITDSVLLSLLRKILQSVRIPYEGEPLNGVQVMGILETRNLDFENVVILSANDDTFPGNLSASSSFIPYTLRYAYGLPTPQHHEGVFGYYFYRLVQRAKRVHIIYSVKADDKNTGEPSRYIYQMDYESPHHVEHRTIPLNVNLKIPKRFTVEKTSDVMKKLEAYLGEKAVKKFSPSTFYNFIECPLKFYFHSIEGMREEEEISEDVDLPMFGNIFHKAAEILYGEMKEKPNPKAIIKESLKNGSVENAVIRAIQIEYFKGEDSVAEEDFGGNITLIREIVTRYIKNCLFVYDSQAEVDFTVFDTERWVYAPFKFNCGERELTVNFGGKVDRIDRVSDGSLRVVDYKTGSRKLEFNGIEGLFSERMDKRNAAVLQTFLYSMVLNRELGVDISPALYYIRYMNDAAYSPYPIEVIADSNSRKRERLTARSFLDYRDVLSEKLTEVLQKLFDPNQPFEQCTDTKTCANCLYKELCNR